MVVLCQYNLVLLSIKWNWVNTRLLCMNIVKKSGDLVGCYHSGTNEQTNHDQGKIELDVDSQWTMDG